MTDVLGVVGAGLAGIATVALLADVWSGYRLAARGERATAQVVRVREGRDSDGDPRYFPVVAFTAPGGTRIEVESRTGTPHPPGPFPAGTTGIVYDPAKPTRIRVDGSPGTAVLPNLLAAAVAAAGAVLCLTALLS